MPTALCQNRTKSFYKAFRTGNKLVWVVNNSQNRDFLKAVLRCVALRSHLWASCSPKSANLKLKVRIVFALGIAAEIFLPKQKDCSE
jgi:hypothetical protein